MGLGDFAVLVDHIGDAARVFVFRGFRCAVCEADLAVGVAEQREGEVVFLGERGVGFFIIEADAEDLRVLRFVLLREVPEPGTFPRSTGSVGFRIKPQHDFLAAQVAEAHAVAVVVGDVEVGSGIAGLEHGSLFLSLEVERRRGGSYPHRTVNLDEWNERYRTREDIDDEPALLLVHAARDLPPGRTLDLACGAGRNAIWLASRGWEVMAIDGAAEAIRIVREHAPQVDARVLDLETDAPLPFDDESFDLVAILFYLHRPLFTEARRVVRRGGIIVAAARMSGSFAIAPGEMRSYFEGDEVLHQREGEIAEMIIRRRA